MKPGRLDTDLKIFEFRNSQHTVSNHLDTHLIISGTDLKIPSYIETCGRIDFLRTDFFVSPPPPLKLRIISVTIVVALIDIAVIDDV